MNKSKVWITDFELTYRLDNSKPWFKLGTPGFMSPQQENDEPPVVEDDKYSLGCVMLLIVTGIEPGRFLYAKKGNGFVSFRQLRDDGSWSMPEGIENTAGKTFTGFAHGVSGIVYFLIGHFGRTRDSQTKAAYERGLSWLLNQMSKHKSKSFVSWPYSADSPSEEWKWWCHGSPGIALTFLRLYEVTRNDLYAEIAAKALYVPPPDIRYINLSQCHGLSGIGEIYLEAYRVLGDKEWKIRADNIASVLFNFRKNIDKGVVWAVQDINVITADLMIGCSGIIHFFLRLVLGGQEIGFPMLPEPLDSSNSR